MSRTLALGAIVLALMSAGAPASQTRPRGSDTALGRELEGLLPGPRIAYLSHLIQAGRADAEVYFQLGVAFQEAGKPDSAIYHYARSAALDTSCSKAYVNWGVALDEQGKSAEALGLFRRAVGANPNDLLAHAHAAFILFEERSYEPARQHLARAFAIDSLHPQPHFYLAVFFWESGMYREALKEWEQVARLAPGSYLASKARENMTHLLQAMSGPAGGEAAPPRR